MLKAEQKEWKQENIKIKYEGKIMNTIRISVTCDCNNLPVSMDAWGAVWRCCSTRSKYPIRFCSQKYNGDPTLEQYIVVRTFSNDYLWIYGGNSNTGLFWDSRFEVIRSSSLQDIPYSTANFDQ